MRPRLLILTPDFPPDHGGVQVHVHRLAREMTGFHTLVLTPGTEGARSFDMTSGIVTRRCATSISSKKARAATLNALTLPTALRFRPDVTLSAHAITSPATALLHRVLPTRTAQQFYAVEILGKPRLCAFAARQADLVIAISTHTASLIAAVGAAPARLRVIPPGVDPPRPARDEAPAETRGRRRTVVTVANMHHSYKGHDVLVEAVSQALTHVPDLEWVVIGDGPLRPGIEDLACQLRASGHARFLGAVSDEVRNHWLARADVFAMPSRFGGEGFGIAYLEAGAHRVPVVAGNAGGTPEAVIDGVSGLLVDPTRTAAVADAITRLLLDRQLALQLGEGGARRAASRTWPAVARQVEDSLMELLDHPR